MSEATRTVKWTGAAGAVCFPLREHGYGVTVEPGKTYTLPASLAESLAAHKDWKLGAKSSAKKSAAKKSEKAKPVEPTPAPPVELETPDTGISESSES